MRRLEGAGASTAQFGTTLSHAPMPMARIGASPLGGRKTEGQRPFSSLITHTISSMPSRDTFGSPNRAFSNTTSLYERRSAPSGTATHEAPKPRVQFVDASALTRPRIVFSEPRALPPLPTLNVPTPPSEAPKVSLIKRAVEAPIALGKVTKRQAGRAALPEPKVSSLFSPPPMGSEVVPQPETAVTTLEKAVQRLKAQEVPKEVTSPHEAVKRQPQPLKVGFANPLETHFIEERAREANALQALRVERLLVKVGYAPDVAKAKIAALTRTNTLSQREKVLPKEDVQENRVKPPLEGFVPDLPQKAGEEPKQKIEIDEKANANREQVGVHAALDVFTKEKNVQQKKTPLGTLIAARMPGEIQPPKVKSDIRGIKDTKRPDGSYAENVKDVAKSRISSFFEAIYVIKQAVDANPAVRIVHKVTKREADKKALHTVMNGNPVLQPRIA